MRAAAYSSLILREVVGKGPGAVITSGPEAPSQSARPCRKAQAVASARPRTPSLR